MFVNLVGRHICKTNNSGGTGMAYVISDECVACGACEPECPENCISESGGTYVIDAAKCSECGACADVCPVEAPAKA